jgi:uncharacterized MAPEG superfamily protein
MSQELALLGWTLVLGLVQLFLAAGAQSHQLGTGWAMGSRDDQKPLTGIAARLRRAQSNLMETLPLFAAAVIACHLANRESALSLIGAQLYFWARLIYVPVYVTGVSVIRSIIWGIAIVGLALVLVALLVPH